MCYPVEFGCSDIQACFPILSTICLELAATVLISNLSVLKSRLRLKAFSHRLSLNTDPTCRRYSEVTTVLHDI